MEWINEPCSVIQNIHCTQPITTTLAKWIQATKVSTINCDKRARPALLPHGVFVGGRSEKHLVEQNRIIQFDIDRKHNPLLNVDLIKEKAAQVDEILFCAKSAVDGCYGFALRSGNQDEQLDRIASALGAVLDRCNSRSVAALRFASADRMPMVRRAHGVGRNRRGGVRP